MSELVFFPIMLSRRVVGFNRVYRQRFCNQYHRHIDISKVSILYNCIILTGSNKLFIYIQIVYFNLSLTLCEGLTLSKLYKPSDLSTRLNRKC